MPPKASNFSNISRGRARDGWYLDRMRFLLLSDVHANALALQAVLRHARLKRWDEAVFLGDAVGYYPQAEEAVTLLRELEPTVALLGNHDDLLLAKAEARQVTGYRENGVVAEVIARQVEELSNESLAFLKNLTSRVLREGWEAVHGAPRDTWEYLSTLQRAQENAPFLKSALCFVGHTHIPKLFASVQAPQGEMWRTVSFNGESAIYRIPPNARLIFNPGSVGQPRDGIPLASYAIFDEEHQVLELYRVPYDLVAMQRLVRERGYPDVLAHRLGLGK